MSVDMILTYGYPVACGLLMYVGNGVGRHLPDMWLLCSNICLVNGLGLAEILQR
jgi:hypothetical protein